MLNAARIATPYAADEVESPPSKSVPAPVSEALYEPTRYGAGKRHRPVAMCASVAIVASLIAGVMAVRHAHVIHRKHELHVINLMPPPPPPPPTVPDTQPVQIKSVQPEIVAPEPVVQVAAPLVHVATAPTPPPPQAVIVAPAPPSPPRVTGPADAGDLSSKMISATPPRYPLDSRRKHEEGTVVLSVLLGVDGNVSDISVAQSSGSRSLDHAALDAVRRWRWSPTIREGGAVMVRGLVKIPFVLSR